MSTPILKKIHSLCLCLLFIQPIFALSNKSSHNLLIINSYNEQAAWSNSIIVPIMQEVGKMSNTSAYVSHLHSILIKNDSLYQHSVNTLFQRYENTKPHSVVLWRLLYVTESRKNGEISPSFCVPDGIATPRPGITIRSMNRQKYRKTPSFPSQGSKTNIISLSYYALLIARKPLT